MLRAIVQHENVDKEVGATYHDRLWDQWKAVCEGLQLRHGVNTYFGFNNLTNNNKKIISSYSALMMTYIPLLWDKKRVNLQDALLLQSQLCGQLVRIGSKSRYNWLDQENRPLWGTGSAAVG